MAVAIQARSLRQNTWRCSVMKLCEYENLPEAEQLELIQNDGIYIGKRWEKKYSILLYQIEDFYIEVIYRKYRCFVSSIRCFRSTLLLEPYLEQIDIEPFGLITV
jgi:hypothetical protein